MKVSVIMITYGHEKYIEQAINSVLSQECNFDVELVISNDCSPDKTNDIVQGILRKHTRSACIKYTKHETNIGVQRNFVWTAEKCRGKYIAICEGDDYWTDSLKLQKQVDFLEANSDYGLVHGDVNHVNQQSGKVTTAYNKTNNIKIPSGNIFDFLLSPSHSIKTMTTCFRKDLLEKYYLNNKAVMTSNWKAIDISIWLMFAYHSKIQYLNEVFATYRLLPESMSRTKNPKKLYDFHQKIHAIRLFYAENYGSSKETVFQLEEHKHKSMLYDAYAMDDHQLSIIAFNYMKTNKMKLNRKEYLVYYATRFTFLKSVINLLK